MPMELIGKRVRNARKRAGLNQGELAARVKMARTSICNIEAGRQGLSCASLYALARSLEVQPRDLLPLMSEVTGRLPQSLSFPELAHESAAVRDFVAAVVGGV